MFFCSNLSVWDKRTQAPKGLTPHRLLLLRTPIICSSFDPAVHHPSLSSCSTQRGWSCSRCLVPLVPTPRVRDKSQLFSVLPAASQGWGQEQGLDQHLPGVGEMEGKQVGKHMCSLLASCPIRCCFQHSSPQDQEWLRLPLLHPQD